MPTLQRIRSYYDPLGRVVKIIQPNGAEDWVVHGVPADLGQPTDPTSINQNYTPTPWESFSYDSNDLAAVTNIPNDNVPSDHYFTPKGSLIDAMGRIVRTREYNNNGDYADNIEMNYSFDVRGNLLLVKDPYGRNVFEHKYDLGAGPLWTRHIDKGESSVIYDAQRKPIEGTDAKGARSLSAYDVVHRPTHGWANNKTGDATTLRAYATYGDRQPSPATNNLNGKPYESYDEAGLVQTTDFDFKGNLLTKIRNVIDSAELKTAMNTDDNYIIDWTGLPSILDATDYQTDMAYDALNRIIELELPTDLDAERKKIIPTYNTAGALEKVDLYSPTGPTTTNYVENIAYNARGQRLLIAFGNNRMTRYVYDKKTFRLQRQRTEGYTKSVVGDTITYAYAAGTNKQDDAFNYDLVGNIVNIFIRVTDCGIGGTPNELDRTFEYDPIYRLTYADGRESDTQDADDYIYNDAPAPSTPLPSNVNYYERNYAYDKLGNINSVVQSGTLGFTRDYTYNAGKNTLQKIENSTPTTIESYTYDACGNTLTTNLNRYYVWNHADQLLCYYNDAGGGPTVFTQYDYAGMDRVSKMVKTGSDYERTIYIDGIFEYVKLENGSTYEKNYIHIMDDKSRIAEVRIGDTFPTDISDDVTYILEDQIGSSIVRLSTTGTIIDEEEYYPFGDSSLRTFTYKRYRYVGKEKDNESGLYYYGARYYSAWNCRFISVDPLAEEYTYLTPYNYAGNRPIISVDIDGMQGDVNTPDLNGGGAQSPEPGKGPDAGGGADPQADGSGQGGGKEGDGDKESGKDAPNPKKKEKTIDRKVSASNNGKSAKPNKEFKNQMTKIGAANLNKSTVTKNSSTTNIIQPSSVVDKSPTIPPMSAAPTGGAVSVKTPTLNGETNPESTSVGQPGEWESLIPIWGSGRSAVDHFQNGNYWRGAGYTALAISDIFLVKSIVLAAGKGIFIAGSKIAVAEEGVKLLGAAPAKLTQEGLEHIVERHWFTSSAKKAGKFLENMTGKRLKEMIEIATTKGAFRANTNGRAGTIAEYTFAEIIGTTSAGKPASSLRVIIGPKGNVISAFPY